jgi:hypothetical protein
MHAIVMAALEAVKSFFSAVILGVFTIGIQGNPRGGPAAGHGGPQQGGAIDKTQEGGKNPIFL